MKKRKYVSEAERFCLKQLKRIKYIGELWLDQSKIIDEI